jgi:Ca2+/Na+ antiporter
MDPIERAHQYLKHTRISIWAIVFFLGVVVYLMITLSQQVSNEEAMDYRSRASEYTISNNNNQISEGEGQQGGNRGTSYDSSTGQSEPLACSAYFKSFTFRGGTPPNENSGTCVATYTCNSGCGCPAQEKTVECPGSYSPFDPSKKVQCDWNKCAELAKAKCMECASGGSSGGQPPAPTNTPIPTATPTPTTPCCKTNGTAEGRVVGPDGSKQTCRVTCGHLIYYPQRTGGGWTDKTCLEQAKRICPAQCAYHKIPACQ